MPGSSSDKRRESRQLYLDPKNAALNFVLNEASHKILEAIESWETGNWSTSNLNQFVFNSIWSAYQF